MLQNGWDLDLITSILFGFPAGISPYFSGPRKCPQILENTTAKMQIENSKINSQRPSIENYPPKQVGLLPLLLILQPYLNPSVLNKTLESLS